MGSTFRPEPRVTGFPPPHPDPPPDLSRRAVPLVDAHDIPLVWFRHHPARHDPIYGNRNAVGRFNAPAREYGVLYLAADPSGAFVETFGRDTGTEVVIAATLRDGCLCRIAVTRTLVLADLTGNGLARLGADARLFAGDHALSRRWALALWHHPTRIDGLLFRSRHDPARVIAALFDDRVDDAVRATHPGSFLDQPSLLREMLDRYGFTLV